jgi:beta-lactamase class A
MGTITRRSCLLAAAAGLGRGADGDLVQEWRSLAKDMDGEVGAAALQLASGRRAALNGDDRFPLASVCKLPIAMAIMAMVAEGKLSLSMQIEIPPFDVVSGVSIIAQHWPQQKWYKLDNVIDLMITQSDNSAVQTLFRMAGGAIGIGLRMKQWGIEGIRVDRDERTCGLQSLGVKNIPPVKEWTPHMGPGLVDQVPAAEQLAAMRRFLDDPRDTGTPNATVDMLQKLYAGKILPPPQTARLKAIMEKTATGSRRIPFLLPHNTVVAHKTGTGEDAGSLNAATNDVGVITLPNRTQLAVAFYLKASTQPLAAREMLIARLARAAYDWAV